MQKDLFYELCIKRIKKYFLIFAIACVVVRSFIYTPVYLLLSSNVTWEGTVLLFLWTELIDPLTDYAFYWGAFAFFIYGFLRFDKKPVKYFFPIYVAATMARYIFSMLVKFALMTFTSWEEILVNDIPNLAIGTVMDCLQIVGVLLLAEFCCRRPLMTNKTYSRGNFGEKIIADYLPVEGFFNFKNYLSKVCFWASLIPAGIKLFTRLYYDVFVWKVLPQGIEEWLLISTYYVADIAAFFIGYFVLLYVLQMFYTDETKRRIEFES